MIILFFLYHNPLESHGEKYLRIPIVYTEIFTDSILYKINFTHDILQQIVGFIVSDPVPLSMGLIKNTFQHGESTISIILNSRRSFCRNNRVESGQISPGLRGFGMVRPQCLLKNRQRLFEQLLGLV